MWRTVIGLFLAVPLPFPFSDVDATALVVEDDGSAVLEVTVEVTGSPAAVLVRGIGPVDELPPVALAPRGDGIWAGLVRLNTTNGVLLAFEYLPSGGGSATLTNLYTLVELGVDPAALAGREPTTTTSGASGPSTTEAPAVYDDVEFTAERTVVNWWVQEVREAMPTVVQEFVTDTGALVLVPTKHLVSARRLRTAD